MGAVSFADVVHPAVSFAPEDPAQRLVLELIDHPWLQRLRDISQTAHTRLVYMFSEHSRFGHSIGSAFLAVEILKRLALEDPKRVEPWRAAVGVAALLHDIGHLAPGSHVAFRTWFPKAPHATHEALGRRIILEDQSLRAVLAAYAPDLPGKVAAILAEADSVPPWCWELVSGGGWNVDRGNWCVADSIMAGVSYGTYNIPALTGSLVITPDEHLAIQENRLDAMLHFAVSRQAMYRQVYQHRVLLAADTITHAIAQRARDLGATLEFADEHMRAVLAAASPDELELETIFWLREAWWRYHIYQWSRGRDAVLADLSDRLLSRRLFKTIRIQAADDAATLKVAAENAARHCGYDPSYYVHLISTSDVVRDDATETLRVQLIDGSLCSLAAAEPIFQTFNGENLAYSRSWLALPAEAKQRLGRCR